MPERREELTTEGGLDVAGQLPRVRDACDRLASAGVRVSLFIDPEIAQVEASAETGARTVELHTGCYADATTEREQAAELDALRVAAHRAGQLGLRVHAGHGLRVDNVGPVASIPEVEELSIGHSIISRSLAIGMEAAVREMREAMDA